MKEKVSFCVLRGILFPILAFLFLVPAAKAAADLYTASVPTNGATKLSELTWAPSLPPTGGGTNVHLFFRPEEGIGNIPANLVTLTNDLGDAEHAFVLNALTFSNSVITLDGDSLVFVKDETEDAPPRITAWQYEGSGVPSIDSDIALQSDLTVTGNLGFFIKGNISGNAAIYISYIYNNRANELNLSGENTYTGGTFVETGMVYLATSHAAGTGPVRNDFDLGSASANIRCEAGITLTNAFYLGNETKNQYLTTSKSGEAIVFEGPFYLKSSKILADTAGVVFRGGLYPAESAVPPYFSIAPSVSTVTFEAKPIEVSKILAGTNQKDMAPPYDRHATLLNVQSPLLVEASSFWYGVCKWGVDHAISQQGVFSCDNLFGYFDLNGHQQTISSLNGTGGTGSHGAVPYAVMSIADTTATLTLNPTNSDFGPAVFSGNLDVNKIGSFEMTPTKPMGLNGTLTVSEGTLGLGGQPGYAGGVVLDGGTLRGGSLTTPLATLRSGTLAADTRGGSIVKEGNTTVNITVPQSAPAPEYEAQALYPEACAYFPFDSEETLLTDASGTGNDLTAGSGSPAFSTNGIHGGCLYLDGSSHLIRAEPVGLPATTNCAYTIAGFFKADTGCSGLGGLFGYGTPRNYLSNVIRLDDSGKKLLNYWYGYDYRGAFNGSDGTYGVCGDGKWHSFVVSYNGANRLFFVDGVLSAWQNASNAAKQNFCPTLTSLKVGQGVAGSDAKFKGWIDDLIILNRAVNAAEAAAFHANGVRGQIAGTAETRPVEVRGGTLALSAPVLDGLVAHWRFDGEETYLKDSGPNAIDLKVNSGTPVYTSNGRFGGAVYFDGSSTFSHEASAFPAALPHGAGDGSRYTIAAWVRADQSCQNNGGWIGWGNKANKQSVNFRFHGNDTLNNYWWGADVLATLPKGVSKNDTMWHCMAGTYDGTTRKLYVDGIEIYSVAANGLNIATANFVIGKTIGDVNFKGFIDEITVYNRALSQDEIKLLLSGCDAAILPPNAALSVAENAEVTLTADVVQPVATLTGAGTVTGGAITVNKQLTVSPLTLTGSLAFGGDATILTDQGGADVVTANTVDLSAGGKVAFAGEITAPVKRALIHANTFSETGKLANWTVEDVPTRFRSHVYVHDGTLYAEVFHRGTVLSIR